MSKPYTKTHWKFLMKVLPKKKCEICGVTPEQSYTKRLVWDHNHKTNIIRGVLCDNCNSWIEQYIYNKQYQVTNLLEVYGNEIGSWMLAYKDKIERYLLVDTGVVYSDKLNRKCSLPDARHGCN
jgi:formate dehydrogenase maturation protein FdhE